MAWIIKTVDGRNVNDNTNYKAVGKLDNLPAASLTHIEMEQSDPVDSGSWSVEPRTGAVIVLIRNYAQREALLSQLKKWFKRGQAVVVVATATEDSVDYQIACRVVNVVQDDTYRQQVTLLLKSDQTAWRSVALQTDTNNFTSTGGTKVINVGGNTETSLIVTFTPTAGPLTGYLYQDLYRLPGVPGVDLGYGPWCMTVNHSALVTASKSQTSGNDLRVFVNGAEVRRWIAPGTNNTSTCKVWFNLTIPLGHQFTLGTGISTTDVEYLEVHNTPNNIATLKKMPTSGVIYSGTEWMLYSSINPTLRRVYIKQRGALGTTRQSFLGGGSVTFAVIPNVITLQYGNLTIGAPADLDATYDNIKPLFDLAASDNAQWVYTASTSFRDLNVTGRTGGWTTFEKKNGTVTKLYDITQDAESGNPALGQKIAAYPKGTGWVQDTATLRHIISRACGINEISMTGQKFRSGAAYPAGARVEKSKDGKTWMSLWSEAKPATVNVWTAWAAHSNVALGAGFKWLSLTFVGSVNGIEAYAAQECLTATVEFVSANLPTGTFLGEKNNSYIDFTFSNDENGDAIAVAGPILRDKVLSLDGELYTATYDKTNAHEMMRLNDEGRSTWIRLKGEQNNTLRLTALSDQGTLVTALSWYRRRI